jgi:hypothetical protein
LFLFLIFLLAHPKRSSCVCYYADPSNRRPIPTTARPLHSNSCRFLGDQLSRRAKSSGSAAPSITLDRKLQGRYLPQIQRQHRPGSVHHELLGRRRIIRRGRCHHGQVLHHHTRRPDLDLVHQVTTTVHRVLERASRQIPAQLSRVPTRHRRPSRVTLCKQQEKETFREYYRKFLTLKLQLLSVDDHIAIHYAISGLRAGVLYSHCIRDLPKNLQELYQLFEKYARSKELHQRKVQYQRKPKDPPQSSRTWTRPAQSDPGMDNRNHQQVHTIANQHPADEATHHQEYPPPPQGRGGGARGRGRGRTQQPRQFYCLFHGKDCAHPIRDCPETKATKDKMSRAQPADNQRVVAHTYHHQQPYHNE